MAERELKWHTLGFWNKPRKIEDSSQPYILFRIWGGSSTEMGHPRAEGVFLTSARPEKRSEAEKVLSIFEYGNSARYITAFKLARGATFYLGQVDPGDGSQPAEQFYIEADQFKRYARKIEAAKPLEDDLKGAWVMGKRNNPMDA